MGMRAGFHALLGCARHEGGVLLELTAALTWAWSHVSSATIRATMSRICRPYDELSCSCPCAAGWVWARTPPAGPAGPAAA